MTGDHGQHWPIDEDLSALRERLQYHAGRAGMRGERLDDLLLVTNEAVINVLEHGGGKGTLAIWQDETHLTIDVTDTLGLLTIWHVPGERPTGTVRGFGLWLMNQLCDEFAIERTEQGSRVRLRMRLGRPADGNGSGGSADSAREGFTSGTPDPVRGAPDSTRDDPGQDEFQVSF
ncbi:ATP-binding protein [Streptosporangium sp. NBC_01495]|uniref:ATP-binding protein n=1 Tax=Streptosporangium sp. NBC_01495 TaxID=2903899 RepID=UPI002E34E0BE|nr:ATP-binding protein [Streptosporangium sp. NBC_01495]